MSAHSSFTTTIVDLEGEVFKGEVAAVSSINELGTFDILPDHANFISLIQDKVILHLESGKTTEFPLKTGVIRCAHGQVEVVLGLESQVLNELS